MSNNSLKILGVTEEQRPVLDFLWMAETEEDLQAIEDTFGTELTEECKALILAAECIKRAQYWDKYPF